MEQKPIILGESKLKVDDQSPINKFEPRLKFEP
jgi:hypothetical protein